MLIKTSSQVAASAEVAAAAARGTLSESTVALAASLSAASGDIRRVSKAKDLSRAVEVTGTAVYGPLIGVKSSEEDDEEDDECQVQL